MNRTLTLLLAFPAALLANAAYAAKHDDTMARWELTGPGDGIRRICPETPLGP